MKADIYGPCGFQAHTTCESGQETLLSGRRRQNYWPILAYHSISDIRSDGLALSVREFESHLSFLQSRGYKSASLSELMTEMEQPSASQGRKVVITFDDGYADNYEQALPLLEKYGFSATFFVVTNMIGSNRLHYFDASKPALGLGSEQSYELMNWSQIRELVARGMCVGSHTCSHRVLSPALTDEEIRSEIVDSRVALEQKLGIAITSFCYPRGKLDSRAFSMLRSAGYEMAVVTPGLADDFAETRYTLKRVGLYRSGWIKFRVKMSPWYFRLRDSGALGVVAGRS